MLRLLITGTNTGVGKTFFAGFLARHLRDEGKKVRYVKAVQTGYPEDDDAALVRSMSGLTESEAVVLQTAREPVAPCFVFDPFPFEETAGEINAITDCDVLLVEGAGGIRVPLDGHHFVEDLITACHLEVALVVPNRLGCLNEAQLNMFYITKNKLPFHAMAVNDYFNKDTMNRSRNKIVLSKVCPGVERYVFDERCLKDTNLCFLEGQAPSA